MADSVDKLSATGLENTNKLPLPVGLLLVSLVFPVEFSFYIGSLFITFSRLVLLFYAFAVIFGAMRHRGLRSYDYMLLLAAIWVFLSYWVNHGLNSAIESGGVLLLEIVVSYWIARQYIHDLSTFYATIRLFMVLAFLMLPFILTEMLISKHFIHDFFSELTGHYYKIRYEERLGLTRAYGPFSHPILMGVYYSTLIGVVWYGYHWRSLPNKLMGIVVLSLGAFASLSSAPILLMLFQIFAIFWNYIAGKLRYHWQLIVAMLAILYAVLFFWSSQSPLMTILSRITLNPQTAYYRQIVWDYGLAEVAKSPIFGIGRLDWERPSWMVNESIDSFWLVLSMRYGLPVALLIGAIMIIFIIKLGQYAQTTKQDIKLLCIGWVVSAVSLFLIGFTVDYFGTNRIFFFFMLGLGAALLNIASTPDKK